MKEHDDLHKLATSRQENIMGLLYSCVYAADGPFCEPRLTNRFLFVT